MKLKNVVKMVAIALVVAAVWQELKKPRGQRDWYGRVAGIVPYEFRPPTPSRVKDAMWNPQDDRLLTDTVFGVGWSVNLAQVKDKLSKRTNGAVV